MASNTNIVQKNEFGKIPLPWIGEEVERNQTWENTHVYWLVSQNWHGTGVHNRGGTIGDALHDCNTVMESHHTSQRLFGLVSELRDDIIQFGTKRRMLREKKEQFKELAKAIIL